MSKDALIKLVRSLSEDFKSTVINYDRPTRSELHPTMKPVGLVQGFVDNSSQEGWLVLDLFGGAGSTLIACVNNHRKCNIMELDPKFVDVIIKRWQDYTGQTAINAETGKNFKEQTNDE